MSRPRWKKAIVVAPAVLLMLVVVAMGGLRCSILSSIDEACALAQAAHPCPNDDIAALVDFVGSDGHELRHKNRAVWAMGQLRDPKALPHLEAWYTGEDCDHQSGLCQDGLRKAIALCKGETPDLLRIASL